MASSKEDLQRERDQAQAALKASLAETRKERARKELWKRLAGKLRLLWLDAEHSWLGEHHRAEAAAAAVEYRPGLPSVEQVRAHEARSDGLGWWMHGRDPASGHITVEALSITSDGKNVDHHVYAAAAWLPVDANAVRERMYRPCLPDGTPCPWGDV